jgi:hypothetical protein
MVDYVSLLSLFLSWAPFRNPYTLQMAHDFSGNTEDACALMARPFFIPVGNSTDSPEPILRPSPTTGHNSEILDVYNPDVGYDAEQFPYQPPQRTMRSTSRATLDSANTRVGAGLNGKRVLGVTGPES